MISGPAFAFHCPKDIKAIDAALGKMSLDSSTQSKVTALRNTGESQHKAGNHDASRKSLAEAMRLLLGKI
ncbi:MAG: hypothetical protein QGG17_08440 [Rhodospirillales bacterium]|jgi:hypothetical protein|nr:hypothetical protein [Rhodospirillales bacterium]